MKKDNVIVKENEEKENLVPSLFDESKSNMYCSIVPETDDDKKKLFNALESCDLLLNDCVGQEIEIKDVYVEQREVIDDETGEVKTKFRTILFDKTGQTYATGSYGIFNIIKKIFRIYGYPSMWNEPLKVKVAKRPMGNGKQSLTLTLV